MPATAVYDIQIQPRSNDLIVAAHGRGVWILDDVQAIQDFARTGAGQTVLFAPHDAYRMWQASPVNSFTEQSLPDSEFVGPNRSPAIFSYYLPKPARHVEIDILAADGHVVKHVSGSKKITGHKGVNRVSWDLTEDGPLRWKRTFEQNRGPTSGAEVVPGQFVVRLVVDGTTREAPLVVNADPRDPAGTAEAAQRHDALAALNAELGHIDGWLNEIDDRIASHAASTRVLAFRAQLTLDPRNVEDLNAPPGLRERVMDLLSRINSSSYQGPTAAQSDELAKLEAAFAARTNEATSLGL
jgi:hypothetical protein